MRERERKKKKVCTRSFVFAIFLRVIECVCIHAYVLALSCTLFLALACWVYHLCFPAYSFSCALAPFLFSFLSLVSHLATPLSILSLFSTLSHTLSLSTPLCSLSCSLCLALALALSLTLSRSFWLSIECVIVALSDLFSLHPSLLSLSISFSRTCSRSLSRSLSLPIECAIVELHHHLALALALSRSLSLYIPGTDPARPAMEPSGAVMSLDVGITPHADM